jgi:hypothetical protein
VQPSSPPPPHTLTHHKTIEQVPPPLRFQSPLTVVVRVADAICLPAQLHPPPKTHTHTHTHTPPPPPSHTHIHGLFWTPTMLQTVILPGYRNHMPHTTKSHDASRLDTPLTVVIRVADAICLPAHHCLSHPPSHPPKAHPPTQRLMDTCNASQATILSRHPLSLPVLPNVTHSNHQSRRHHLPPCTASPHPVGWHGLFWTQVMLRTTILSTNTTKPNVRPPPF